MAKLVVFNMATVDGFFAGPHGEIDWHTVDAEFNDFALAQLDELGGLLFGRVTYQLMADYWPSPTARKNDPLVAERMNSLPKVVFSRSLGKVEWSNARLVKGDAAEEAARLKSQPGKDLAIMGSAILATSLMRAGCIDELRIMVNPVVLGVGRPLFGEMGGAKRLKLLASRRFRSGNVLLTYASGPA